MIARCRTCGKRTVILYPALWAYRKGPEKWFCSWKCLRAFEKGIRSETSKMNLGEKRRKAVDIALEGGDPVEYFRQLGQKNPSAAWCSLKAQLREKEPETYERLPKVDHRKKDQKEPKTAAEAMANMKQAADNFFGSVLKDAETPEAPKTGVKITPDKIEIGIINPVGYDGFTVREVEGSFARYRRSDVSEKTYVDVEIADGCDTISYTVEQWRSIRKEFSRAAVILGVEI
jgi:hypothetical protein